MAHAFFLKHKLIQNPANCLRIWQADYPEQLSLGLYRPVTSLTFLVDFAIAGLNPKQFHRTNLLLHTVAVALQCSR